MQEQLLALNEHGWRRSDPRLEDYLDPAGFREQSGKALKPIFKQAARSAMDEYLATVGADRHRQVLRDRLSAAGVHAAVIAELLGLEA